MFMWIENKIEGDRNARIKLDKAPMRPQAARQGHQAPALAAVSLWTGFTLVGYFTPVSELINNVMTNNLGPWETFWIFFYGGFTYLFAGFMREQVCKYMCPYARFQSVMFDPDTLIITYDPERGEPRGRARRASTPKRPDWGLCRLRPVRAGLPDRHRHPQRPAIRVHRLRRLYRRLRPGHGQGRFATRSDPLLHRKRHGAAPGQEGHPGPRRPPAHPALHRHPAVISGLRLVPRPPHPLKVDIIRDRSVLAREADDGRIENVYMLQIMNTEEIPHRYRVSVDGLAGAEIAGETEVDAAAAG
jgi:polyferredoxin